MAALMLCFNLYGYPQVGMTMGRVGLSGAPADPNQTLNGWKIKLVLELDGALRLDRDRETQAKQVSMSLSALPQSHHVFHLAHTHARTTGLRSRSRELGTGEKASCYGGARRRWCGAVVAVWGRFDGRAELFVAACEAAWGRPCDDRCHQKCQGNRVRDDGSMLWYIQLHGIVGPTGFHFVG